MVDVRNALKGYNKNNRYRKYPENIERFNEKIMGCYTSKYFECNDNMTPKISNEKQKKFLDTAAKIAEKSPMYPHKHGAIIVYRDKIISSGFNYYVGDFSVHAEVAAISHIKKKK